MDIKNILSLFLTIKFNTSLNMNSNIIICDNYDSFKFYNCSINNYPSNPFILYNDNIQKKMDI